MEQYRFYKILWSLLSVPVLLLLLFSGTSQNQSVLMKGYSLTLIVTLVSFFLGGIVEKYRPPVQPGTLRFFSVTLPATLVGIVTIFFLLGLALAE